MDTSDRDSAADETGAISRRSLIRGAGAGAGLLATGAAALGIDSLTAGSSRRVLPPSAKKPRNVDQPPAVTNETLADGVVVPVARWVVEENSLPGTLAWILSAPNRLYGFADHVSASRGDTVTLYLDSPTSPCKVVAYRMGYYAGLGARQVWESDTSAPAPQPTASLTPGIFMIECHWSPSIELQITSNWPPGSYLLKVSATDGSADGYVPLCVRDDSSTAAAVIMHGVSTWQAYNTYGGYSLYTSPAGAARRSRVVSYDRPYYHPNVENDYLGNEFPLLFLAEKVGLDVTYITDVDLHQQPGNLLKRRSLYSLGHDEYWSSTMREGASSAVDQGVNIAFLGSNAVYRHIRFEASSLGEDRHQVCYKNQFMREDPLWGIDPSEVTADWPDGPDPRPEQSLVGEQYSDVSADADMVVVDPGSWVFEGTGLTSGQHLPRVVRGEYDHYEPYLGPPSNVTILAHSPVVNRGPGRVADMTYYTRAGGGGVVATGTASFVGMLSDSPGIPGAVSPPVPGVTPVFERITENIFSVFGAGPAGASQPSSANWSQFYG